MILMQEPRVSYFHYLEKLHNFENDIDYIYNKFFSNFIKDVDSKVYKPLSDYTNQHEFITLLSIMKGYEKGNIVFDYIKSSELSSEVCKKAHIKNPIKICGGVGKNSFYVPSKFIFVSLSSEAYYILTQNKDLANAPEKIIRRLRRQLSVFNIKASIAHELTHWVDDSLFGVFSKILSISELQKLKQKNVNMEYFEIQAQIHAISELKKIDNEYNNFTLEDLFTYLPSLGAIGDELYQKYNKEILDIWLKLLLSRLSREKLLTKNMLNIIDYKIFESRFCV